MYNANGNINYSAVNIPSYNWNLPMEIPSGILFRPPTQDIPEPITPFTGTLPLDYSATVSNASVNSPMEDMPDESIVSSQSSPEYVPMQDYQMQRNYYDGPIPNCDDQQLWNALTMNSGTNQDLDIMQSPPNNDNLAKKLEYPSSYIEQNKGKTGNKKIKLESTNSESLGMIA